MTDYDNRPEWGYCKSPDCNAPAEPLWFAGGFPDDPDLLCCYKHTGLFIGALKTERNLATIERGLLEKELAAAVAHHEHTMDIIEKALGEDRHAHEGVWLAESIALDIRAIREQLHDLRQTIIQMRDGGHELPGSLLVETFKWEA